MILILLYLAILIVVGLILEGGSQTLREITLIILIIAGVFFLIWNKVKRELDIDRQHRENHKRQDEINKKLEELFK